MDPSFSAFLEKQAGECSFHVEFMNVIDTTPNGDL